MLSNDNIFGLLQKSFLMTPMQVSIPNASIKYSLLSPYPVVTSHMTISSSTTL